jgi:hypothetical protein
MGGQGDEEILIALPSPRSLVPRATHVRGSWLSSSVRTLREDGLFERYLPLLPPEHHATMTTAAATEWYPIEVAIAHYGACDRLELSAHQIMEAGIRATRYAHATVIGVAAKLAVGGGEPTPWTIFGNVQRLWDRSWSGGGIGVTKLGPTEMRLELVGWPLAHLRHTRIGMRGVLIGIAEVFCKKAYAREIEEMCTPLTLGYRLAWT